MASGIDTITDPANSMGLQEPTASNFNGQTETLVSLTGTRTDFLSSLSTGVAAVESDLVYGAGGFGGSGTWESRGLQEPTVSELNAQSGTLELLRSSRSNFKSSLSVGLKSTESQLAVTSGPFGLSGPVNDKPFGVVSAVTTFQTDEGILAPLDSQIEVSVAGTERTLAIGNADPRPKVSRPPPGNALIGEESEPVPELTANVKPAGGGVGQTSTILDPELAEVGALTYKGVTVEINEADGTPSPEEPIVGPGFAAVTDGEGEAEIYGPIGDSFNLAVFDSTYSAPVTLTAEQDRLELTYPQLSVRVIGPDFLPLSGVPVFIDGVRYTTNSSGAVTVGKIGIGSYDIVVQDYYATTATVPQPGVTKQVRFSPNTLKQWSLTGGGEIPGYANLNVTVRDEATGQPVRNARIAVPQTSIVNTTGRAGQASVLLPPPGAVEQDADLPDGVLAVIVDTTEGRYQGRRLALEHPGDESVDRTIRLSPATNTTDL